MLDEHDMVKINKSVADIVVVDETIVEIMKKPAKQERK